MDKTPTSLGDKIKRITRAPQKPQQRLQILVTYLPPAYTHGLIFGWVTADLLKRLD